MNEKTFKYLDKGRQIDLSRLIWHTISTYGLSAILEQMIDLVNGAETHEKRLAADLKKTLANYEARYELDLEDNELDFTDNDKE
jgi:hypothetical protein